MRDALLRQLDAFDLARRRLLDELAPLPPRALTFTPSSGGWSILGAVEHVVRAERAVLQDHPEPSALVDRPRGLRDRLAYELVRALLRSPVSVGTPSRAMDPQGGVTLADLRRQWDESQAWLRADVTSARDLRRAVFAHPVTGPIGAAQAVALSRVHLGRHTRQTHRLQLAATGGGTARDGAVSPRT